MRFIPSDKSDFSIIYNLSIAVDAFTDINSGIKEYHTPLPGSGRVDTAVWMHYLDANKTAGEEARRQLHKNAPSNLEQVLAATPPQGTNYIATCLPSRKLSKLDVPDMQNTTGEARTTS